MGARFAALQREVTKEQVERLFALDTRGLREGGTDLKGGTTLAGALLAGTGALSPAKSVRAVIEGRRAANWGQGKSKPPLNAAASRLEAERKRARAAVQRPETRERAERELAEQAEAHGRAKRALDAARGEARRLNRIALTRPHLLALEEAEGWLAAHPDVPALPAGLDAGLAEARGAVAMAHVALEGARGRLAQAEEAVTRIRRDPGAMAVEGRLAALPGALGEAEKAAKDREALRAELAARREDVRSALREIGADVGVERAGEVVPTLGLMAEARAAITEEIGLRTALELATEGVAGAERALEAARAVPVDEVALPEGLTGLLDAIRGDRANPVQHAAELAEASRVAAAKVARLLALVPGWEGTAEALRALALPSDATFERMDGARQGAVLRAAAARQRHGELAAREGEARAALDALRAQRLPDAERIAAARAERDRGMGLVLRRAFGTAPTAAEESAYAGGEGVGAVFERRVREADELADQRMAELGRVQEAERLGGVLAGLARPLEQAALEAAEAERAREAAEGFWGDAVAPLRLDRDAGMAELRKALAGRQQVIEAMEGAAVAAGAARALGAVHSGWAARLGELLGAAGETLEGLLGRADRAVAAVRAAETAAVRRQAALEATGRDMRAAEEARGKAERALTGWCGRWAALLERLQRPGGESPAGVAAVLGGIDALKQHHREAVSLERRLAGIGADLEGFGREVAGLAEALGERGGEDAAAGAAEMARVLIARAGEAVGAERVWKQARLGLEEARAAEASCVVRLAEAGAGLDGVIAGCGAATAEEAEVRIAASRAHAEQTGRRDAARAGLAEHGDGLGLAVLRGEVAGVPVEEMGRRRREAEEAATAAMAEAEAAAVRLNELRTVLEAEAGATGAIDTRADYEAAVAAFGRRLEEQLVLHLASSMLGDAMRSVEEQIGGSSLARVSEAFGAVTGGAYGLETHEGVEGEELHAVEHAWPQERKSLDELSEGTRDQLYLALRMVALRDHCGSGTALPFIADDILQTFDDRRAEATLRALVGLSEVVQVIVLTHHRHMEGVAAGLGERVRVVRL